MKDNIKLTIYRIISLSSGGAPKYFYKTITLPFAPLLNGLFIYIDEDYAITIGEKQLLFDVEANMFEWWDESQTVSPTNIRDYIELLESLGWVHAVDGFTW